jgi:hypothetical protein
MEGDGKEEYTLQCRCGLMTVRLSKISKGAVTLSLRIVLFSSDNLTFGYRYPKK